MTVIKVKADSRATAVAGAIAGIIRDEGRADMRAVGAGAVNQGVKAIAIARKFLQSEGVEIVCYPYFVPIEIGENERTAMGFTIEPRQTSNGRKAGDAE